MDHGDYGLPPFACLQSSSDTAKGKCSIFHSLISFNGNPELGAWFLGGRCKDLLKPPFFMPGCVPWGHGACLRNGIKFSLAHAFWGLCVLLLKVAELTRPEHYWAQLIRNEAHRNMHCLPICLAIRERNQPLLPIPMLDKMLDNIHFLSICVQGVCLTGARVPKSSVRFVCLSSYQQQLTERHEEAPVHKI